MIIKWFAIALTVVLTFLQFDQSRNTIKWTAFCLCLALLLLGGTDIYLSDRDQKKIETTLVRTSSRFAWENVGIKVNVIGDIKNSAANNYQVILKIFPNKLIENLNVQTIVNNSEPGPNGCKMLKETDAAKLYSVFAQKSRDEEFNLGIETIFFGLDTFQKDNGFDAILFKHGADYHLKSNYTSSYDLNGKIIVARILADTGNPLTISDLQIELDTKVKPSTIAFTSTGDRQHGAAQFEGVKYVGLYIPKEYFQP